MNLFEIVPHCSTLQDLRLGLHFVVITVTIKNKGPLWFWYIKIQSCIKLEWCVHNFPIFKGLIFEVVSSSHYQNNKITYFRFYLNIYPRIWLYGYRLKVCTVSPLFGMHIYFRSLARLFLFMSTYFRVTTQIISAASLY